MPHTCSIESRKSEIETRRFSALTSRWLSLVVISAENPLCSLYLRSETAVRAEKIKQLSSKHPFIIHPLSQFRKWYNVWTLFFYIILLIVKPIDGSIGRKQSQKNLFPYYREVSLALDFVSWIVIIFQFGMGYTEAKKKVIEMRPSKIARNYLFGPYFIVDILSSVPKYFFYPDGLPEILREDMRPIVGCINISCLLKSLRLFTVLELISKISFFPRALTPSFVYNRQASDEQLNNSKRRMMKVLFCEYLEKYWFPHNLVLRFVIRRPEYCFHIKSGTSVFLMTSITASLYVLHLSSCLMLALPRLCQYYFGESTPLEWKIKHFRVDYKKLYIKSMFKSSACLLGIRYDLEANKHLEEFLITIITYVIGKLITAITWVVLAVSILNSRSMTIKYHEMINQLHEYMRQKQLPTKLKNRILQYYTFKYQRKYFKEDMINRLLSDNLRNDINIHVCRSLIEQVSLFADLSYNQVSTVVAMLVPEIFLPRDVIIQSGTSGDSMYFLSSGTVAVYTHSGKEVCHLKDGAYFGEISLVVKDQARTATIIAIEVTQVYRLKRKDFERTLGKNRSVYERIIGRAEQRLKETLQMEESYKIAQFEKTYTKASVTTTSLRRSTNPLRFFQAKFGSKI